MQLHLAYLVGVNFVGKVKLMVRQIKAVHGHMTTQCVKCKLAVWKLAIFCVKVKRIAICSRIIAITVFSYIVQKVRTHFLDCFQLGSDFKLL